MFSKMKVSRNSVIDLRIESKKLQKIPGPNSGMLEKLKSIYLDLSNMEFFWSTGPVGTPNFDHPYNTRGRTNLVDGKWKSHLKVLSAGLS